MHRHLTVAAILAALTLPAPAAGSPETGARPDPSEQLQYPMALDRGPDPRVLSLVDNTVRFPSGRTARFTRPEGVGRTTLIGRYRSQAIIWAPVGEKRSAVFKVWPSGALTRVGKPFVDSYGENGWQIAGNRLYVMNDAGSGSRLSRVDLADGRVLRTWVSTKRHLWNLLDVTRNRALIASDGLVKIWRSDGGFDRVYVRPGNAYSNIRFGSLRHDWFAQGTTDGTELRRLSAPRKVVWKQGYENEMIPFDISGDGSVLLTTEYETYSPQLREARTGRVLRAYSGGYHDAYNDYRQIALEGSRAFLVVMNLRVEGRSRQVLVRCTVGGSCERASRLARAISLVTYGS